MMPSYPQRQQRYIQLTGYNIRGKRTGNAKSVFYSLLEGFEAMDLHRKYTHTQHYNYLRSLIITHTHITTIYVYIYSNIYHYLCVFNFCKRICFELYFLASTTTGAIEDIPMHQYLHPPPFTSLSLSLSLSLLQPGCLVSSLSRPSFP